MNLGVYLHIPFCRKKCDYCNFYSITVKDAGSYHNNELIDIYVKKLLREIESRSAEFMDYTVDTIYIGGGTPSLIRPDHIKTLIEKIKSCFLISKDNIETTIECNPEDFSAHRIAGYKGFGVNRIVLGVQTLNRRMHALSGRSSRLCGEELLSQFKAIDDIVHCVDLITAFPGQTPEELTGDLDAICKYGFEHISAYILAVEKGTKLAERIQDVKDGGEAQRELFESVIDFLAERGYRHYEVSNFAIPTFESKHNMKYWRFQPYAGFGAAAHSFYAGARYYNPPSVSDYIGQNNPLIKDVRPSSALIVEFLMTGMRLLDGVSLNDLEEKTGQKLPDEMRAKILSIRDRGYLIVDESGNDIKIRFTRDGLFMMDGLIYEMTEMLI
ncbi:MAG: radical SAM family heme chaperone HemW [Spirochaetes bacterium]|jgi:oxygen-independent coproporphyrinogen-3 oxidase|nr:radical SAM family heme chaperone HemW [Spirochaetota bacterium]